MLIREGAPFLAAPVSPYFTQHIRQSVFPSAWKLANVIPIFKKGAPSNPANYRPISLLSCLGTLMECCVHKVFYNYLVSKDLWSPLQSGVVKGDSTINQLTFLYNDVCKALDAGKEVRAICCDISKAFDRVCYTKCKLYGFTLQITIGITMSCTTDYSHVLYYWLQICLAILITNMSCNTDYKHVLHYWLIFNMYCLECMSTYCQLWCLCRYLNAHRMPARPIVYCEKMGLQNNLNRK